MYLPLQRLADTWFVMMSEHGSGLFCETLRARLMGKKAVGDGEGVGGANLPRGHKIWIGSQRLAVAAGRAGSGVAKYASLGMSPQVQRVEEGDLDKMPKAKFRDGANRVHLGQVSISCLNWKCGVPDTGICTSPLSPSMAMRQSLAVLQ